MNPSFIIVGDMLVFIYLSCCHLPGNLLLSDNSLHLVMPQQPFCFVRHKHVALQRSTCGGSVAVFVA